MFNPDSSHSVPSNHFIEWRQRMNLSLKYYFDNTTGTGVLSTVEASLISGIRVRVQCINLYSSL